MFSLPNASLRHRQVFQIFLLQDQRPEQEIDFIRLYKIVGNVDQKIFLLTASGNGSASGSALLNEMNATMKMAAMLKNILKDSMFLVVFFYYSATCANGSNERIYTGLKPMKYSLGLYYYFHTYRRNDKKYITDCINSSIK